VNTEWVSPWVTTPAHQLANPGMTYTLQMQWTKTGTVYCGSGGSWMSTTMADVTNTTAGMTYYPYVAFAISLEYEFVGNNKIVVAVGDSITEGAKHIHNIWGWHNRFAMRTGMPVINAGDFGSFAGDWGIGAATLTQPRWQRLRDADCNIDAAIMYLGTNETAWGGTLLQIQQGLHGTYNRFISELAIPRSEIYALTLHPRNLAAGSAPENLRASANNWLRSGQPMFNVIDITRVTENGGTNNLQLIPGLEGSGSDYTHPGPSGQLVIAERINVGP
jgi:lysophospholipase L1-like esterase